MKRIILATLTSLFLYGNLQAACIGCSRLEILESSMNFIINSGILDGNDTHYIQNDGDGTNEVFSVSSGTVTNFTAFSATITHLSGTNFASVSQINSTNTAIRSIISNVATDTTTLQTNLNANWTSTLATYTYLTTLQTAIAVDTTTLKTRIDGHDLFISSFATSVSISSLTVYGTITSTTGYNGVKSTGTFGGIRTDIITFPDGSFSTSAVAGSGGGGGTSQAASTSSVSYGLIISSNGTSASQIKVVADEIDIMGDYYVSVSTVMDFTKAGAGGLSGAEAASTWYDIYLIAKGNGGGYGIIASSYTVFPTLPIGYTKWRKVGCVFNDSSSNIIPFYNRGGVVQYFTARTLLAGADPTTTFTDVDLQNLISPYASAVDLNGWARNNANGSQLILVVVPKGALADNGDLHATNSAYMLAIQATPIANNLSVSKSWSIGLMGQRIIKYSETAGSTANLLYLYITGYREAL